MGKVYLEGWTFSAEGNPVEVSVATWNNNDLKLIDENAKEYFLHGVIKDSVVFDSDILVHPTEDEIKERKKEAAISVQTVSAAQIAFVAMAQLGQLDDLVIVEHPFMFITWCANWTGKKDTIVIDPDDNGFYKSIHDVGAGQNTQPSKNPSMWTRIGNPSDEWPEWIQPIGAHDAYILGAKVSHNGNHWNSTANGNVWEPGVYGWEAVV